MYLSCLPDDDEGRAHLLELSKLAEKDPEFYKYLQENEPELLDGNLDPPEGLSDEEEPQRKKQKKTAKAEAGESSDEEVQSGELTKATLKKWETALTSQHSLRATREIVMAFRAASHISEDGKDQNFKYSISDPGVYHQLLTLVKRNHQLRGSLGLEAKRMTSPMLLSTRLFLIYKPLSTKRANSSCDWNRSSLAFNAIILFAQS